MASATLTRAIPAEDGGAVAAPRGWFSTTCRVVLVLLAAQFLALGLWQAARDAPTVDEAVDVASGTTSLVRHDLRLNPEHGPLPKALSALPALLARPVIPDTDAYRQGDWFDYTDDFISANRASGRLDRVLFLARIVPLLEGLAAAWVLLVFGRRLFGEAAGALAAMLWLTTPVFVGFAHFAMIDIAFTLATLLVCDALARYLQRPSARRALLLGVLASVALLTRHSALVLVLTVVAVVMIRGWRHDRRAAARSAAIMSLVAFGGVWLGVLAIDPNGPAGSTRDRFDGIVAAAQDDSMLTRLTLLAPFPLEYRAGVGYLGLTSDDRPAYAFGQAWDGGRWWFFPAALVTKLPLGGLLAVLALPLAWRGAGIQARRLARGSVLVPAAALFVFIAWQPLNLGLRYAFPVVALLFVATGPLMLWLARGWRRWLALLLVGSQTVAFWQAAPSSLAWTAPPFRPAYRWVSDSNVDYGQDLYRVEDWVDAHGPGVWTALLTPRGLHEPAGTKRLRGADLSTVSGWVAVSATRLTVLDRDELSWLRAYCPVESIGDSVLIYRFAAAPDSRPGPTMPAAPCTGAAFSTRGD